MRIPWRPMMGMLAVAAWLLAPVAAADSMRCGSEIVSEGDSRFVLLDSCGEPDEKSDNKWYYRLHQHSVTIVHIEADVITLIEIERT